MNKLLTNILLCLAVLFIFCLSIPAFLDEQENYNQRMSAYQLQLGKNEINKEYRSF